MHVLNHTGRYNGNVHAAVDLACGQAMEGDEVTVVSGPGSFDLLLSSQGIRRVFIDQRRKPLVIWRAAQAMRELLRRGSFDIVHAHMMTSALLCWPACRSAKVPLVTTVHNEFQRSAIVMALGARVIAVSQAVAKSLEKRGMPRSRLRSVLNGTIGSPRYAMSETPSVPQLERPAILYVGGLHPRKGLLDLIQAFCEVLATAPSASLHIVGEGPCGEDYKKVAAASPGKNAIFFHGATGNPLPWFLEADVFVCPSHDEPAGLVLSEACEAGCAIVASDVGGIPEMLNWGGAGKLVPPKQPKQLARAVLDLIETPQRLKDAKHRALANRDRLRLSRVVGETRDVYKSCFQDAKAHRRLPVVEQAG